MPKRLPQRFEWVWQPHRWDAQDVILTRDFPLQLKEEMALSRIRASQNFCEYASEACKMNDGFSEIPLT